MLQSQLQKKMQPIHNALQSPLQLQKLYRNISILLPTCRARSAQARLRYTGGTTVRNLQLQLRHCEQAHAKDTHHRLQLQLQLQPFRIWANDLQLQLRRCEPTHTKYTGQAFATATIVNRA